MQIIIFPSGGPRDLRFLPTFHSGILSKRPASHTENNIPQINGRKQGSCVIPYPAGITQLGKVARPPSGGSNSSKLCVILICMLNSQCALAKPVNTYKIFHRVLICYFMQGTSRLYQYSMKYFMLQFVAI